MKIKVSSIKSCVLLFVMWILFAFNTSNADRVAYETNFNFIKNGYNVDIEQGYYGLVAFFERFGLNYDVFQFIVATIWIIFIGYFVMSFSNNSNKMLLLYFIFPFVLDTIQIRNTMGCMFCLLGFLMLHKALEENKVKKGVILYSICIFLATLFHQLMIVYMLYLLVLLPKEKLKRIALLSLPIEFVAFFGISKLLTIAARFFPKINIYVNSGAWGTRFITKICFICIVFFPIILYKNFNTIKYRNCNANNFFYDFGMKIAYINCLFCILFFIEADFFRIFRNLYVLIMIPLIDVINIVNNQRSKFIYKFLVYAYTIFLCWLFVAHDSQNIQNLFINNVWW